MTGLRLELRTSGLKGRCQVQEGTEKQGSIEIQHPAPTHAPTYGDSEVDRIAQAWPDLNPAIRTAILGLVRS